VHYDPLLAKVIAYAETRDFAIERLAAALRDFPILGIRTNVPFVLRILESAEFRAGRIHTSFLDDEGAALAAAPAARMPDFVHAAMVGAADSATAIGAQEHAGQRHDPWSALAGWRG
jgi:acetyl/propionyl-CoA carboxylase alpha subunit